MNQREGGERRKCLYLRMMHATGQESVMESKEVLDVYKGAMAASDKVMRNNPRVCFQNPALRFARYRDGIGRASRNSQRYR